MTRRFVATIGTLALLVTFAAPVSGQPAQTPGVQIQDKPRLLADVDYYDMLARAEAAWKESIPKLQRNYLDYLDTWRRLRDRRAGIQSEWYARRLDAPLSKDQALYKEMYDWCGNVALGDSPLAQKPEEEVFSFAEADVRVRLCEEKLPPVAEKSPALQPNYGGQYDYAPPRAYPNKPVHKKSKKKSK